MRELSRYGWRVSLFGLSHGEMLPSPDDVEQLQSFCENVLLVPFRRRHQSRGMLVDLARRKPYHQTMFADAASVDRCRAWLRELSPDAISIETHYMAPYVPDEWFGRALLDAHNAESHRLETMARALGWSPRGLVARSQLRPTRRFEAALAARASRLVAVSAEDRAFFEELAPGRVDLVPNGVDCLSIEARAAPAAAPAILYLASLDYSANVDALAFLVDEIAPLIECRQATITVVGSNPRPGVFEAARRSSLRASVEANVPDTAPYWRAARCLAVPLRVGGGTRLKILEAMAWGVPVVSTTLGCEGLGFENGRELLVADEPAAFAAAVDRLLGDTELCHSLSSRARQAVEERYDWSTIGAAFARSLATVLETTGDR